MPYQASTEAHASSMNDKGYEQREVLIKGRSCDADQPLILGVKKILNASAAVPFPAEYECSQNWSKSLLDAACEQDS